MMSTGAPRDVDGGGSGGAGGEQGKTSSFSHRNNACKVMRKEEAVK